MSLIRGDALTIPVADNTVDLIVTSPPYFALRSYTDDGDHYAGQLGLEATPAAFIDALIGVTRECVRVLKPSGSLFVNLGDKYSGAQAQNIGGENRAGDSARTWAQTNPANTGIRNKSLMGLPWRYALRCIDELSLILRAEIIWSKPNGLPESVQDRVRRSHEQWFHFTLEPRYYSAVDEIREKYEWPDTKRTAGRPDGRISMQTGGPTKIGPASETMNPLGKLPGSVWTVPTEPLRVPDDLPQHFAAFPSEWPRRIILGWSPSGICCECGEGRRPDRGVETGETEQKRVLSVAARRRWVADFRAWCRDNEVRNADLDQATGTSMSRHWLRGGEQSEVPSPTHWAAVRAAFPTIPSHFDAAVYSLTTVPLRNERSRHVGGGRKQYAGGTAADVVLTITGESCACPTPTAPTRPAVVLDPFAGTGTTVAVANHLGRYGIGIDLSNDYLKLAHWRLQDPGLRAKALGVDKPTPEVPGQMALL